MAGNFFTKLKAREKLILYASVAAVFMAFFDRLVLAPATEKMNSFEDDISFAESQIKKNVRILAQQEKIVTEEKRFSSYAVQARSDEEEVAGLLRIIENIATSTAVYLVDLKPAGVNAEGLIKKFMVNISCEGQMEQLLSFMYKVENSDVILKIAAFSISPKSKQSSVTRCELVIYKIVIP